MPEVDHLDTFGFSNAPRPMPAEKETPSFLGETVPSAFRLENDVMNLWELTVNRQYYPPTPGFNPRERLQQLDTEQRSALWETHGPKFVGVRSEEEFQAKLAKIKKEEADREVLDRAGMGGFLAQVAAGMASPTVALPFIGNARGAAALLRGAGWGAAGAGMQELPLVLNQETRTKEEVAFSLAASTVLGGVLGGAIGVLRKPEVKLLEERLEKQLGMVFSPGEQAIPGSVAAPDIELPGPIASLKMGGQLEPQTWSALAPELKAQVKAYNTQERFVAKEGEIADYFVADAETGLRKGSISVEVKLTREETAPGGKYVEPTPGELVPSRTVVRENVPDFQTGKAVVADVFHGTAYNFEQFDAEKLGTTTQANSARMGFFFSRDPRTANVYADLATKTQVETAGDDFVPTPPAQVRMERVRLENPFVQDFDGGRRSRTYAEIIAEAKALGHDGVIFKNTRDGGPTDDIFVVFSPDQIAQRSAPQAQAAVAAFDVSAIGKNFDASKMRAALNDNLTAIPHNKAVDDVPVPSAPKVDAPANTYIPADGGSGGAAFAKQTAGGVAKGIPQWIIDSSPVLRTINQQVLKSASWLMAQFSDAGVQLADNVKGMPSAIGGSLESLVKQYDALYVQNHFVVEDAYADYFYQGAKRPDIAPNLRAGIGGMLSKTQMSKAEFRAQVSMALWSKDKHDIPQVQKAAQELRKNFFDPMLKDMQRVGLVEKEIDLKGDVSYLFRDYDIQVIRGNTNEFIQILAENYEKKALADFQDRAQKLLEREGKTKTLIEDLQRPAEEVEQLQGQFKGELAAFEKGRLAFIKNAEETINDLRQQARVARRAGDDMEADRLLDEARSLEKEAGPMLEDTRAVRSEIKTRLRNLNKSKVVFEKKQQAKLALIERLEDMNIGALETAVKRGRKILDNIDNVTEEQFMKEVRKFMDRFADVSEQHDRTVDKIAKLTQEETGGDLGKLLELDERQGKLGERMTQISEQLDEAEQLALGVPVFREILQAQLDAMLEKVNTNNSKRAVRSARLQEQANNLNPEIVTKRIEDLKMASEQRRMEFLEKVREGGADDIDLVKGTADFRSYARAIAEEVKDKIIGTYLRSPAIDMLRAERGAELARALNIDSRSISKFLRTDVDELMRKLSKTLGPDIEIQRRFGSLDFETEILRPVAQEMNAKLERFQEQIDKTKKVLADKEKRATLTDTKIKEMEKFVSDENVVKTQQDLNTLYFNVKRDLEAVYERLRGEWGVPDDPEAIGYRLGKVVMSLNVLRFMGGTMISSMADVGRPIMKHGLMRVFGDGFNLLVNDLKSFKLSAKEVQLAGAALDVVTHSRSKSFADLMTDYATTTKFERGVDFLSNKMGIIAMFDYWTSGLKQFSGVVANARFLDSVQTLMTGKGTAEEIQAATTFLASHNIGRFEAEKIFQEMQNGGARQVRGTWFPDTEVWKDKDIVRIFRAAVVKSVNDTIIEPGVELPLVMNKTIANRMLFQFKSFGMSSTYKTLGAGLQQRDMAVVNGMMVSLAFGALSYYTYAMAAGGKVEETMRNADAAKWADEAIQRSGLLAVLGDGQRIAERLPYVGKYATASGLFGDGERLQKNAANGLIDTLLGPSFGFARTLAEAIAGLEEPTQATAHKLRTLAAFQNHFLLRRPLDAIEASLGLPERRE